MNHVLVKGEQGKNTVAVDVISLDDILNEKSTVMKIDVEGYETPVLEGAIEILKKQTMHSVILELNGSGNRYGFDEDRILDLMRDYGFKIYSYKPLERELVKLDKKNQESGNTLFIRDEEIVRERLRNAPKVLVNDK